LHDEAHVSCNSLNKAKLKNGIANANRMILRKKINPNRIPVSDTLCQRIKKVRNIKMNQKAFCGLSVCKLYNRIKQFESDRESERDLAENSTSSYFQDPFLLNKERKAKDKCKKLQKRSRKNKSTHAYTQITSVDSNS
jgi:hypothetical protein